MPLFVFDPVGNLSQNRITNEPHTVNTINGVDHNYFVPRNGPFYDTSMVVVDTATGNALVNGVDIFFAYPFEEATTKVGSPISGAVVFIDPNRTGNFLLTYQTLGGEYVSEISQAITDGIEALVNLVNRKWENIVDLPAQFPPTPHTHRLDQFAGIAEILAKFTSLEAAIKSPERHITMSDIVDIHEGYVEPLTTAMANIAASISALSVAKSNYYVDVNTGSTFTDVGAVDQDVWTNVGLEATVSFAGTYMVMFSGNIATTGNIDPAIISYRYLVDDQPISQSMLVGGAIGLSVGSKVTLQFKVTNTPVTGAIVSDAGVSCGLTLLRVSD